MKITATEQCRVVPWDEVKVGDVGKWIHAFEEMKKQ